MDSRDDGSEKSRAIALVLGAVLGPFGAHRFYVGKIGTGLLQAVTFGGMGIWWLYDMVLVSFGAFTDSEGRRVKYWSEEEAANLRSLGGGGLSEESLEELYALRDEVADLSERVDFTERLLARGRHEPS